MEAKPLEQDAIRQVFAHMGVNAGKPLNDFEAYYNLKNSLDRGSRKKAFGHLLKVTDNQACILPLSDLHVGLKTCDLKLICAYRDFILSRPNIYTILMGDQEECATRESVGLGIFDQSFSVDDQVEVVSDILTPLAMDGRILGVHGGNHERRIAYFAGLDLSRVLADNLGVEHLGYQGYHVFRVGDQTYTGLSMHGMSKASVKTARQIAVVDVYLTGHTHENKDETEYFAQINTETLDVELKEKRSIVCGSGMQYWGSYAEMTGYQPQKPGFPMILLSADHKEIRVLN